MTTGNNPVGKKLEGSRVLGKRGHMNSRPRRRDELEQVSPKSWIDCLVHFREKVVATCIRVSRQATNTEVSLERLVGDGRLSDTVEDVARTPLTGQFGICWTNPFHVMWRTTHV